VKISMKEGKERDEERLSGATNTSSANTVHADSVAPAASVVSYGNHPGYGKQKLAAKTAWAEPGWTFSAALATEVAHYGFKPRLTPELAERLSPKKTCAPQKKDKLGKKEKKEAQKDKKDTKGTKEPKEKHGKEGKKDKKEKKQRKQEKEKMGKAHKQHGEKRQQVVEDGRDAKAARC